MLEKSDPRSLRNVGHSPARQDALDKLTGAAVYVSDMAFPGMLHARVKKSPHARARIRHIDISRAARLAGVRAILVINPELVRGQCIGGMIQGLGTALCEGYIYDQQGHLLNPSFTDNKIPTSKDLPDEIECIIVETAQLDGPYGARGVGKHPMISVAPALGNAIRNAVGAELTNMPIRSEDVWRAMGRKEPVETWITKTPTGSCRSVTWGQ